MTIHLISFTQNGLKLSNIIAKRKLVFNKEKVSFEQISSLSKDTDIKNYVKKCFEKNEPIIFISAVGIAVRLIVPHIKNKLTDIPVVVTDEKGRYVIPVLSGHFGGANELAMSLSKALGAECIITTATDINDAFAVDVFARNNDLMIRNKESIAYVSGRILSGEKVTLKIDPEISYDEKKVPACILIKNDDPEPDIHITSGKNDGIGKLNLYPRSYTVGIGCKKGTKEEDIRKFVFSVLKKNGIDKNEVSCVASIDIKKDEKGLVSFACSGRYRFMTFSSDQLMKVKGDFSSSEFVRSKTGADNVCERAAVKASGRGGKLIVRKTSKDGITVAVAKKKIRLKFDK